MQAAIERVGRFLQDKGTDEHMLAVEGLKYYEGSYDQAPWDLRHPALRVEVKCSCFSR